MNKDFATLSDVNEFIGKHVNSNLSWDGNVLLKPEEEDCPVVKLRSFGNLSDVGKVALNLKSKNGYPHFVPYFQITTCCFQMYQKDFLKQDSYQLFRDLSPEWVKFQCDKYGDEFKDFCKSRIKQSRDADLRLVNLKIQELRAQMEALKEEREEIIDRYDDLDYLFDNSQQNNI